MAAHLSLPLEDGYGRMAQDTKFSKKGYAEGDKENAGRKRPSNIPLPPHGRIHDAQLSPVHVNAPAGDWPPRPSTGQIEGEEPNGHRETSTVPEGHVSRPYKPSPSRKPSGHTMPPNPAQDPPMTGDSSQRQQRLLSSDDLMGAVLAVKGQTEERHIVDMADQPVPRLQYFHQAQEEQHPELPSKALPSTSNPAPSSTDTRVLGTSVNRHLTPNSQFRRSPARPMSSHSGNLSRDRSPGPSSPGWDRAPSVHSARSFDTRPMSYVDLTNVSYPQAPPPPVSLDNSQLRAVVGSHASLLSTPKTLELYLQNLKKTSDSETQYAFAVYLIQAAQDVGLNTEDDMSSRKPNSSKPSSPYIESAAVSSDQFLREARHILQRLADRSYPFAQYYLADGYASGLFNKGKEDYGTAFPLFVAASKHGHAESSYRAALCYEFAWGCRKDSAKAVQYFRQAASKNHPGAMTRLGRACLSGDLGLNKYREGLKWLNRATESADQQYNAAPFYLGQLFETGYGDDVFKDESYAAQLFTQAAELGNVDASYRLGDAYEHGKLSCPRDPALSVHFYTGAAQRGHPAAMMALCAWYMVGAEPVMEKDENEAYEWARQAANTGLEKAEYAVGYFTEMGIGCRRDPLEANVWYVKAADSGDERAKARLAAIRQAASGTAPMLDSSESQVGGRTKKSGDKECTMM